MFLPAAVKLSISTLALPCIALPTVPALYVAPESYVPCADMFALPVLLKLSKSLEAVVELGATGKPPAVLPS